MLAQLTLPTETVWKSSSIPVQSEKNLRLPIKSKNNEVGNLRKIMKIFTAYLSSPGYLSNRVDPGYLSNPPRLPL